MFSLQGKWVSRGSGRECLICLWGGVKSAGYQSKVPGCNLRGSTKLASGVACNTCPCPAFQGAPFQKALGTGKCQGWCFVSNSKLGRLRTSSF